MRRIISLMLVWATPLLAGAQPAFGDSSFENIAVSPGNFVQAPASPVWNFTNVSDNASGVANGNGSWGIGGSSGPKYAYVQKTAQLSQTVGGFVVGRQYEVHYDMMRRSGSVGGNDPNRIAVQVNGTTVSTVDTINDPRWRTMTTGAFTATATSMNFRWQGLLTNDRTSLFDNFRIVESTTRQGILADGDFEIVNYLPSGWSYNPGPILGSDWNFGTQGFNRGAGTASTGSPWGSSASTGRHFAFVQADGVLSQRMTNLTVGATYFVKFDHSRRADNSGHRIRVLVDGIEVLAPTLAPLSWSEQTSLGFVATASSMTLRFEGIVSGSTDRSSLIDNVRVVPEPSTIAILGIGVSLITRRRKRLQVESQANQT